MLQRNIMPKRKKKKVVRIFTLSAYDGMHYTQGTLDPAHKDRAAFAESFSPLIKMIERFVAYPLGTKIRVTMEVK